MKKKFLYIFLTILLCITMVLPFMANALKKPLAITAHAAGVGYNHWDLSQTDYIFVEYENLGSSNTDYYVIFLDNIPLGYTSFYIYFLGESPSLSDSSLYYDWGNRYVFSDSEYGDNVLYISKENVPVGSFLTVEPLKKNIKYSFVVKFDNHEYNPLYLTGNYMEGFLDGVKYDQTQVVEGSASWNSAYEKGYNDYGNDNAYGPFVGATYDAIFDYANTPQIILRDQIPQLSYNYLTFPRSIYETYIEIPEMLDNYVDVEIVINLKDSVLYSNYTLSRFGDDANILGSYFEDIDGVRYSVSNEIPIDNSYNIFAMKIDNLSPPNKTVQIKKIGLIYGRPLDTFPNSGITISEGGYLVGYNTGVNDGKEIGRNEGIETGKEIGRKEGEEIGYEKAVLNGVGANGIFNSTIAIISTCFTLAGTFFGTKIAGDLTIGLFVIGIPATFMIINLIISLVKNLLSAGGSKGGDD